MKPVHYFCIGAAVVVQAFFLASLASHLSLQSYWPPSVVSKESVEFLKSISFTEPIPIKPIDFSSPQKEKREPISRSVQYIPDQKRTWLEKFFSETQKLNVGYDFFQFYRAGLGVRYHSSIYRSRISQTRAPKPPATEAQQQTASDSAASESPSRAQDAGLAESTYDDGVIAYVDALAPFHHPFRYFPLMAWVVGLPLSYLSPYNALGLWIIVLESLFFSAVYLTIRWFGKAGAVSLMWVFFMPFYLDLYLGQTSFIIAFLLFLALAGLTESRDHIMRLGYVFGMLIKPVSLFLSPNLLILKRWKLIVAPIVMLAASSLLYFISFPADFKVFWQWFTGSEYVPSVNLTGILAYVIPAWGIKVLSLCLLLVAGYFSWKKSDRTLLVAGLWLTTYFLTYPHVWEHHYIMLVPLLILLWVRSHDPKLLLIYVMIALPNPTILFYPEVTLLHKILIVAPKTLATILLYSWLLAHLLSRKLDDRMNYARMPAGEFSPVISQPWL